MLDGVDLLLVDLQDAGARYYTYPSTTIEVMRAAAARGKPVVVLDRPDPIGGRCRGRARHRVPDTPVGLLAVPMRHGMTLGELPGWPTPTSGSRPTWWSSRPREAPRRSMSPGCR